jgi:hypothetical protein
MGEGNVCFLLTSACAIMLEFVAVYSLFAVSPFPADTEERGCLSKTHSGLMPRQGMGREGSPWVSPGTEHLIILTLKIHTLVSIPVGKWICLLSQGFTEAWQG